MALNQHSPARRLPKLSDAIVTRRLCATAYLNEDFARVAWETLVSEELTGLAPPMGVDYIAVIRHVAAANRLRERRDQILSGLDAGILLALSFALRSAAAKSSSGVIVSLTIAAVLLVGGFAVVCSWLWEARNKARSILASPQRPAELADPVDAAIETALAVSKRTNAVVYHSLNDEPFVGAGWHPRGVNAAQSNLVWPAVNVNRPAKDAIGQPKVIKPFTTVDLLEHVAKTIAKHGLPGLRARNRLYVRGVYANQLPELLPDPNQRPVQRIPSHLLASAAKNPGEEMYTWLCLEMRTRSDLLIVSMYARAVLATTGLSWHVAAYVLPPIGPAFYTVDRLPQDQRRLMLDTVLRGLSWGVGFVVRAPQRLVRRRRSVAAISRRLGRIRRDISRRYVYDYGAFFGLRELVADWGQMNYNDKNNATDLLQRMHQGLADATEEFLESRNVDVSDFRKRTENVTSFIYNFNGAITGPNHNFGPNGVQNNSGQAQGAAQHAPAQQT